MKFFRQNRPFLFVIALMVITCMLITIINLPWMTHGPVFVRFHSELFVLINRDSYDDEFHRLLQSNSNLLHQPDMFGNLPLHYAARNGRIGPMVSLLRYGADVDARISTPDVHKTGRTPLHVAVRSGQIDAMRLLIANGADVNAPVRTPQASIAGMTPLHIAVKQGDLVAVKLLIAHGADPTIPSAAGVLPVDLAEHRHRLDIAEYLRSLPQSTDARQESAP